VDDTHEFNFPVRHDGYFCSQCHVIACSTATRTNLHPPPPPSNEPVQVGSSCVLRFHPIRRSSAGMRGLRRHDVRRMRGPVMVRPHQHVWLLRPLTCTLVHSCTDIAPRTQGVDGTGLHPGRVDRRGQAHTDPHHAPGCVVLSPMPTRGEIPSLQPHLYIFLLCRHRSLILILFTRTCTAGWWKKQTTRKSDATQ
jgi:hypothetical protein